ncbi:MAG: ribosomal protein S18-alanine N-acetyltransferase [bacterium]
MSRTEIWHGIMSDLFIGKMVIEKNLLKKIISADVRTAGLGDLDSIVEIEELSYTHPWSRHLIMESLSNTNALNFVAFDKFEQKIYGFILNLFLIDELHILNIAVEPSYRRCGIGSSLLEASIDKARQLGGRVAFLEVRRSNIKALTMYIKHGFRVVGVRRGYYSDNHEDALVMEKVL